MNAPQLTERYIQEVVRRIPADQRADVADELRATIADTIEARDEETPEAAERAVLTEMGDPIRLAARYADRPLALIGPELYPAYIRLLVVLLTTVLPIAVLATVVIDALDGDNSVGSLIGAAIGGGLTIGAQMFAWLTVVFVIIDRVRRSDATAKAIEWTPDLLPALRPAPDKGGPAAYASVVWYAALIVAAVWQHVAAPYRLDDGSNVEVLNPALWSNWIWPILTGLAGMAALEIVRIVRRGWTFGLVVAYTVADLVFALPLAWIFYDKQILNPAFLADFNGGWTTPDAFYSGAAIVVIAISATEAYKRFKRLSKV
ncbi:MAG TPA: permease prefix domain 1-containing protein [Phytomonospora sp.]